MGIFANFGEPTFWLFAVMNLVVFILSLSVHEYAHARVAFALGDDTAARQGRMTLNPISHIDPFGTILMPILGSAGMPVIGWAKPVPVNPANFSRKVTMRGGMALTAAAGPVSNIVLAFVCVTLLWLVWASGLIPDFGSSRQLIVGFLVRMTVANIGLAVFNLLPIPPLDGSRLMPRSLDGLMEVIGRYSFFAFILIILFGRRIISIPVVYILYGLFTLFGLDFELLRLLTR